MARVANLRRRRDAGALLAVLLLVGLQRSAAGDVGEARDALPGIVHVPVAGSSMEPASRSPRPPDTGTPRARWDGVTSHDRLLGTLALQRPAALLACLSRCGSMGATTTTSIPVTRRNRTPAGGSAILGSWCAWEPTCRMVFASGPSSVSGSRATMCPRSSSTRPRSTQRGDGRVCPRGFAARPRRSRRWALGQQRRKRARRGPAQRLAAARARDQQRERRPLRHRRLAPCGPPVRAPGRRQRRLAGGPLRARGARVANRDRRRGAAGPRASAAR